MAMIATTISNSISVKPRQEVELNRFIVFSPLDYSKSNRVFAAYRSARRSPHRSRVKRNHSRIALKQRDSNAGAGMHLDASTNLFGYKLIEKLELQHRILR